MEQNHWRRTHVRSQHGVPIAAESQASGSVPEEIFTFSFFKEQGEGEHREGDMGEDRVDGVVRVAGVEEEEEEEEVGLGRHSSQQQQQQSMNAWPSERHRHSSNTGVAEERANTRNCPIRLRAGRAAGMGTGMYASVMLHMLSGKLHAMYTAVSAITVERSRRSLT